MGNETWDAENYKVGHIAFDEFDEGVRIIVMRGPVSWNAYLGVSKEHPLAGYDYDSIPLHCHGGLTFSGNDLPNAPSGYYWYGWDYAHCGDYLAGKIGMIASSEIDEKKWTASEVLAEAKDAMWDFKLLAKLAEKIQNKYKSNL